MAQSELPLITHKVENRIVQQRAHDGYINATEMCRAGGETHRRLRQTEGHQSLPVRIECRYGNHHNGTGATS